jgi:hypothetical protein
MKFSNIRNLLLVSLALPLVMLFGCSSSEESSGSSDTSGQPPADSSNCDFEVPEAQAECERAEALMN